MGQTHQTEAIFSNERKVSAPLWSCSSQLCYHSRSHTVLGPLFTRISSHSTVSRKGSPSCGVKVQRGGSKTLCPFEFFQLVFGSLGHQRLAHSSTVMSADAFAFVDHTQAHDIRPFFAYGTLIMSFYLLCYPPTSKECTYQSFTDRRLVTADVWSRVCHICRFATAPQVVFEQRGEERHRRGGDGIRGI